MTAPITAEELRDWQRLAPTLPLSDQMLRLIAAVEALVEMKRARAAKWNAYIFGKPMCSYEANCDRAATAYDKALDRAFALVE
jgi:hypothetical protein